MMRRNTAIVAAACAAALAAVLALGQQPPAIPTPPPEPASSDPLELFTVMVPTFTHPRCANCHGAVDPHAESGPLEDTHDGGIIEAGGTCANSGCHTQTNDTQEETRWQTASPFHNFNGKTAKELCDMQSGVADDKNARRPDGYYEHLNTDFLIDLAFVGQSGGANSSTDPPPLHKDDFLKAARAWVNVGNKCNSWTGSITQHETFASSYSYLQGGAGSPIRVTVHEQAQRIFTLDRANGDSEVRINQGGQQTMVTVITSEGPYGPCETTITSNNRWTGQNQGAEPGGMNVQIRPDGSYTIRFSGPAEKTVTQDSGHASTNCPGAPPGPTADTTDLDWNTWRSSIHCPANFTQDPAGGNTIDCDLYDSKTNPRLKGTMVRTLRRHEDAPDPQSWMEVSTVGISRSDTGAQLPVTVVTTWDFTLPP